MKRRPTHVYESLLALGIAGALVSWIWGAFLPLLIGISLMCSGWLWHAWALVLDECWMEASGIMGKISQTILLGIIYFLILTPIGFLGRLTGRTDRLLLRQPATTTFQEKKDAYGNDMFKNPW